MNRFNDWLKQADKDLEAANDSKETTHYEWACFQAQQSAEKALKALLLFINVDSWGHGLVHLFKKWQEIKQEEEKEIKGEDMEKVKNTGEHGEKDKKDEIDEINKEKLTSKRGIELLQMCQELDMHYIQPRFPNGFAVGYPAEYYNEKKANESIQNARNIIQFVKEKIKEISSSE